MAQRLVEGSLGRLFDGRLRVQEVVAQLTRALEDGAEGSHAPDHYTVMLNPEDHAVLLGAHPDLAVYLADQVLKLTQQAGLELSHAPMLRLQPALDLPAGSLRVKAEVSEHVREQTQALRPADVASSLRQDEPDGDVYLIIDGHRHVVLDQPVYTLGRRLDCDVVLSDPRVSRRHVQLRWRFGRYILYDLGSTGGTMLNGHPVIEAVLEPGDVFSLGGVDVIYGREPGDDLPPTAGDTTNTWVRPVLPSE